jgi:hypothetical protein
MDNKSNRSTICFNVPSGGGRFTKTKEEREQDCVNALLKNDPTRKELKSGNKSSIKQVNATGFFAEPNTKDWSNEMVTHALNNMTKKQQGRGVFDSVEELADEFKGFVNTAQRTGLAPTIAGLAFYLGVSRDTIYSHAANQMSPFHDICKLMIDYCHTMLETGATMNKLNSVSYIFQAKNYFGMKDQTDVVVGAQERTNINNSQSIQALKDQISKEDKIIDAKDFKLVDKDEG